MGECHVFQSDALRHFLGYFYLLADAVDEIWLVTAPEETRMARIMARNGCSREEAVSRIRAQMPDVEKEKFSSRIITNSDEKPIIPQILSALATL